MTFYSATQQNPTIAAIATARGMAGVAVLRISGAESWSIAKTLFSRPNLSFQPGRFYHGWILDPWTRDEDHQHLPIDEVLLLIFKGPHSFTGEDVVEIHCHGGDFLSRRILELCLQAGALPAPPGEFTKRAFLSGRIDLTQAESVMDLIGAQGDALARMATTNLKNRSLGNYLNHIGERLIEYQSQIVASVDFPDEVDEPERSVLVQGLTELLGQVTALEAASLQNRLVREGMKVAILGMPNSGKSSLFNALLASERAIVTDIAGTTRDILTERLLIDGVPMTLIDTAGIRDSDHAIEVMGIERSWQAAEDAQAILYVYDVTVGLTPADREILDRLTSHQVLRVANKMDQISQSDNAILPSEVLGISVQSGQGLTEIFRWLESLVGQWHSSRDEALSVSLNQRQLGCLSAVQENLAEARESLANPLLPIDLTTVPLTEALRKLDELMGRDTAEEVLTSVFSQFCVGK